MMMSLASLALVAGYLGQHESLGKCLKLETRLRSISLPVLRICISLIYYLNFARPIDQEW